jgi:WD40 repeat protein
MRSALATLSTKLPVSPYPTEQIYSNETPLAELNFSEFVELVVRQDVRPERPDEESAPQLSDAIWELVDQCWVKDPKHRPTANAVCDAISRLLDATPAIPQISASSLSPAVALAQPPLNTSYSVQATPSRLPPPSLTLRGHTNRVTCATFSYDGQYVVSGSLDCTIIVWDAQTGNPTLGPLKKHTAGVHCVAFSVDRLRIASGSDDNTIRVWDVITGGEVAGPFEGHTARVSSISFSSDGKRIASGSSDKTIRIWDAQTGSLPISPLTGHIDPVTSVTFSMDGKRVASGSYHTLGSVRIWDVKSGRLVRGPFEGHNFVAFSPDGKRIVSSSRGGSVFVLDADSGVLVSGPSRQHTQAAVAVSFVSSSTPCAVSPDGKWILGYSSSNRPSIHVWASETGLLATRFKAYTHSLQTVTFSPDSRRILSSSSDKTIRIHSLNL